MSYATLSDMQRDSVTKYKNQPLFGTRGASGWEWITYGDLNTTVDKLTAGLASLGLGHGDRIAIISNNRVEWAATAHAAFRLGMAIVPMYEAQNEKEWQYILDDSGAKAALVANDTIAGKINVQHKIVIGAGFQALLDKGSKTDAACNTEDVACLMYTSGTTGKPKGVILTHANFVANVNAVHQVLPIQSDFVALSFLPWAHAFGQTAELHTLMSFGCSMALVDDVGKILQYMQEVRPMILVSVPRIFNRIYTAVQQNATGIKKALLTMGLENEAKYRASPGPINALKHAFYDRVVFSKVRDRFGGRMKFAVSGGAAISREVADFIDKLGIVVLEGYGLTETAPVIAVNTMDKRRIGTVGAPLPNVKVKISDEGEIVAYGPNIMRGYYNLPEETKDVFTADGGFKTGDLGHIDQDGFLVITGRIKEQYKLENGKYVAPAPLEETLKLSPLVQNALVYGDNKLYNVALIVPNQDEIRKAGVADVNAAITAEIERVTGDFKGFEKIKKFAIIDEDFTTANGMLTPKMSLKRKVILEKYKAKLEALY